MLLVSEMMLVNQPGAIVGPIANLLGGIYNYLFNFIYGLSPAGSLGLTIILFTLFVKILLLPLSIHQQKTMVKTQVLQPEIQKIQEKYKKMKDGKSAENQQKQSRELSELYKKHNANPAASCLPLFIQLPILYALFYIFQQAYRYITVIGNIYGDLTNLVLSSDILKSDNLSVIMNMAESKKIFKGLDIAVADNMKALLYKLTTAEWSQILQVAGDKSTEIASIIEQKTSIEYFLGISLIENPKLLTITMILPILSGATTWLQTYISNKMGSQSTSDANNMMAAQMKTLTYTMPILMTFITFTMPCGLGLYWTISNIFSIGQNILLKKVIVPHSVD